jgi:hypothetical protein
MVEILIKNEKLEYENISTANAERNMTWISMLQKIY